MRTTELVGWNLFNANSDITASSQHAALFARRESMGLAENERIAYADMPDSSGGCCTDGQLDKVVARAYLGYDFKVAFHALGISALLICRLSISTSGRTASIAMRRPQCAVALAGR